MEPGAVLDLTLSFRARPEHHYVSVAKPSTSSGCNLRAHFLLPPPSLVRPGALRNILIPAGARGTESQQGSGRRAAVGFA